MDGRLIEVLVVVNNREYRVKSDLCTFRKFRNRYSNTCLHSSPGRWEILVPLRVQVGELVEGSGIGVDCVANGLGTRTTSGSWRAALLNTFVRITIQNLQKKWTHRTVKRYCIPFVGSSLKSSGRFATGRVCFP